MKLFTSLCLTALLLASTQAHAATLSTTLANGTTYGVSDTLAAGNVNFANMGSSKNVTDANLGPAKITTSGAQGVVGAISGAHAIPPGLSASDSYLSIYNQGTATFTVTQPANKLSFSWSTVDPTNVLNVYAAGDELLASISGTQLQGLVGADALQMGTTGEFFVLTALKNIAKIVMTSGQNSFEVGSMAISSVPLPAALPLFAVAMAGMVGLKRRRKQA